MNRRGFIARVGGLVAGAFVATKSMPSVQWKGRMWVAPAARPQRVWFSAHADIFDPKTGQLLPEWRCVSEGYQRADA